MAAVAGVGDDCYVFARISMFSPSIFPVVVVAGFVDDSSEFAKQIVPFWHLILENKKFHSTDLLRILLTTSTRWLSW